MKIYFLWAQIFDITIKYVAVYRRFMKISSVDHFKATTQLPSHILTRPLQKNDSFTKNVPFNLMLSLSIFRVLLLFHIYQQQRS